MSQLITINLSKGPGTSWGFRLQGGKDFAQPLCIQKVNIGSVAEGAGLQAGDAIVSIGGSDALTLRHKEAQDAIVKAGGNFTMVVQRGAMTWRPQVTALAQPKNTPEGPVATQTSLAAKHPKHTETPSHLNVSSSHNNSPRPFPGSGNWVTTSPVQSPVRQLDYSDTPPQSLTGSRSPFKHLSFNETPPPSLTRPLSPYKQLTPNYSDTPPPSLTRSRSPFKQPTPNCPDDGHQRPTSRGPLRASSQSPTQHRTAGDGATMPTRSRKSLTQEESGNTSIEKSFKSTFTYSSQTLGSTKKSVSSSSLSPRLNNFTDGTDVSVVDGSIRGLSTPPIKSSLSPVINSPSRSPIRSPSPSFQSAITPNQIRSNRSPSPYYNSNYSRTPRSVSPSCSIPSNSSMLCAGGGGSSGSSLHSPTVVRSQVQDPVADLEARNSLRIDGADISLDKENARNFLRMQIEKEREKEINSLYTTSGTRKLSRTTSKEYFLEEQQQQQESYGNVNRTRTYYQDSHNSYKSIRDNTDSSSLKPCLKTRFSNKSSDNLFRDANITNIDNVGVTNCSSATKVSDNIRKFEASRRHSSCVPPQIAKTDFRARTLDRGSNSKTYRYSNRDAANKYNTYNRQSSNSSLKDGGGGEGRDLRRTGYSGSCSNLLTSSSSSTTNCNVPWKNHFSNLRRRSGTGPDRATSAERDDVNGQQIVNPQYNSPINLYDDESIAEALSAQSEVLGQGCLGVNFMKNNRQQSDKESDVLRMVQEMDAAPKTPPVATGSSSVYSAALTPSEMIGTPEIPIQGASFKILERFLCGDDDTGSRARAAGVSSPVQGTAPGAASTRSVQAPVTKARPEGAPQGGGATVCSQCERPIIGVFVRIKDKNLHADCFKCNTCGSSLKNVGYYNISDKLYCDVHAKQAAKQNPPGPNMVPVTVKPGAAPPAGAMPASAMKAPAPAALDETSALLSEAFQKLEHEERLQNQSLREEINTNEVDTNYDENRRIFDQIPEQSIFESQPELPTFEPQAERPTFEPQPKRPAFQSLQEQPTFEPQPERPIFEPQPELPTFEPQPERPIFEPQPERPIFERQPERPIFEPQAERPTFEPQAERPTFEPQAERHTFEPQPERPTFVPQPQPERPTFEPQPERPIFEPQPERPIFEPQPERPTFEPQAERPIFEPRPEQLTIEPQAKRPIFEPQPEQPIFEPRPEQLTFEPQPELRTFELQSERPMFESHSERHMFEPQLSTFVPQPELTTFEPRPEEFLERLETSRREVHHIVQENHQYNLTQSVQEFFFVGAFLTYGMNQIENTKPTFSLICSMYYSSELNGELELFFTSIA